MMSEEDEEVLFDRGFLDDEVTTVLPASPPSPPHVPATTGRVSQTICLCAAFFGLGLCIAIPGPTLLDLQEQTDTNTEQISRIFTGRSVGYLCGSVVGGFLFDYINQPCLLSLSLLLTAVGTAAAPWCKQYVLLVAIVSFQGISMGFLDTGGNVLCLYLWGRSSGPFMQTMHFAFGVGAFVAPLLAEPFLSHSNTTNITTWQLENTSYQPDFLSSTIAPVHQRFVRDLVDENTTNLHLLSATTRRPKPQAADALYLDPAKDVADGSKVGKELQKINKAGNEAVPSPTPSIQMVFIGNMSLNESADQTSSTLLTSSTTTTTTTMSTTTKGTPTTTTTTTTTTPPFFSNTDTIEDNSTESLNTSLNTDTPQGTLDKFKTIISDLTSTVTLVVKRFTKVQFAYFAIAGFVLLVSVAFMCVMCCCAGGCRCRAIKQDVTQSDYTIKKESTGFRVQILILLFIFYFLYVGMEVTFGGFLMTFSVSYLEWSKAKGTMLTSVFWGSFAAGRGLAIPLSKCLTPTIMLVADLVLSTLSMAGLVIGLDSNHVIIWFCAATLGIGMASIFPTGITWAERYMHVTGKATAVFVVGSALGEMLLPLLVGFLFQNKGPMWLLYVMLACVCVSLVIYIIMQNLASNMGERYERLSGNRRHRSPEEIEETEFYSLNSGSETEDSMELDSVPLIKESNGMASHKKHVTFNLRGAENGHVANGEQSRKYLKSSILKSRSS